MKILILNQQLQQLDHVLHDYNKAKYDDEVAMLAAACCGIIAVSSRLKAETGLVLYHSKGKGRI